MPFLNIFYSSAADELLFSRPNTKQSWVGSLGGIRSSASSTQQHSPALSAAKRAVGDVIVPRATIGIYGSIDGGNDGKTAGYGTKGQGGNTKGGDHHRPNMYSVLATDSIPMLSANEISGGYSGLTRNGR